MHMPSTVYEQIAAARQTLVRAGLTSTDAALDAEVLARHALGWDRARLLAEGRDPAPAGFGDRFAPLISRRATREPVAFITGRREFWGLDFEVSHDVLIPRPETELIVEGVCAARPVRENVRVIVDVGTGSGCLAVALAHEFGTAHVIAVDISAAALAVARRNADRHGVANRISFVQSDLLEGLELQADVIVSNPPYVPSNVALSPEIVRFEPPVALYSGVEGLSALERLIGSAGSRIRTGGLLAIEFGLGQDDRVLEIARRAGWKDVDIKEDLQQIPRVALMGK